MIGAIRRLAQDRRGSPAIEFAIVAPVMLTLMLGLADLAFQAYVQAVLSGALQKAGRDSSIQGGATQAASIDQKVQAVVGAIARGATFASSRSNYDNYSAISGEPFVDSLFNGSYDGICNHGEAYTDLNSNGRYDTDPGEAGQGGANDVTRYTMTVTYNRLFPLGSWIGWGSTVTLTATTTLKNQPFSTQTVSTTTSTCLP